jgi:AraC-like DNA-binding protein
MVLTEDIVTVVDIAASFIISRKPYQLKNLRPIDVANEFNVDVKNLSDRFEKERFISISKFIEREKFNNSFLIIDRNPNISIEELCKTVGFSKKKLNKLYKSQFLVSVGQYKYLAKQRKTLSV